MADNTAMIPMIAPDGTTGSIPQEQVADAIKAGGKLGVKMLAPDGTPGTIPMDRAHDAIKAGASLAAPGVPKPTVSMQPVDVSGSPQGEWSGFQGASPVPDWAVPSGPVADAVASAAKGFVKGASQTLAPGPKNAAAINRATGLNVPSTKTPELQTQGTAESVGSGLEGVGEFVLGDEMLKGMSLAERAGLLTRIAKLAESHPVIAKALGIGVNAIRTGTVGGVQGIAHGETPTQAASTAATTAGTGAAFDVAGNAVQKFAPKAREIAGEIIPIRASQGSKAADALEDVARSKPLQRFDIEQTQPAAKRAVGNVANDVPRRPLSFDTAADRVEALTDPARNFSERAKQVRKASQPVFQKLDELTAGEDMKFSDWQKQEKSAIRRGDYEAATKAKGVQDRMISQYADEFDPDDLKDARANWRQASALDKVHEALNTKAIFQPTPVKFRPVGVPDPGYIRGKNFSKAILALKEDGTLRTAGLSAEHIQALQDVGSLLEKSGGVQEQGGMLAKAAKAAKIVAGGPMTGGGGYAASAFLSKIMTDEEAARKVASALRSIGPAVAAQSQNPE